MESRINRRNLLKAGAAFSIVGGSQFFTGIPALAAYAAGPTVRRNASAMAASDPILRGYRLAIKAMRALPNNNPCSWFYQAAIHGTTDPRQPAVLEHLPYRPDLLLGVAPHVSLLVRADRQEAVQYVRLGHSLLGLDQSGRTLDPGPVPRLHQPALRGKPQRRRQCRRPAVVQPRHVG